MQQNLVQALSLFREKRKIGWDITKTPEEVNKLIPQITELAQEVFDKARPFKEKGSWRGAFGRAWNVAASQTTKMNRSQAWTKAYDIAVIGLEGFELDSLALAAAVEVVSDQGIENPRLPEFKIYVLGAERVSFQQVKDQVDQEFEEKLVVEIPLDKETAAVLVYTDGKGGDEEIKFVKNRYSRNYSSVRPLISLREIK
ncbi:MAG: hypothetical protein HYT08_04990 [Candidatus Levybacteria bacterium]|nr:hypothetical protein [Candidatus Levybacteria bacterium]